MINTDTVQALMRHRGSAPHADRILCQLNYAMSLSGALGGKWDDTVSRAADLLSALVAEEGALTKAAAKAAEEVLLPLSEDAKKYRMHCVAHAHIDMNWMWGYQETVSVTVDTFRTVLNLMKEYPHLTFGQSQASTYEIIEKYAPSMLPEIRERIREGRWDVTAATWVETDKNMPSGESLARHILYTARYLSRLLEIPAGSLNLDFEPDTFGHNVSVPEISAAGGVKYYYHCRGNDDAPNAYVWRGRAGGELLVYREPHWYNSTIDPNMFWDVPLQCEAQGISCLLNVYGVGDHGGGPTRRDVERLTDMATWPVMPTVLFSTYTAFFKELEAFRSILPVETGEKNFVFDGCFTSQAKIKMANRIAEARIYESEALAAEAAFVGGESFADAFRRAWCDILFNHFHDILPGSGVVDTREYALGHFQDAMATVAATANLSMRRIAEEINTEQVALSGDPASISEGGGVGFAVDYKSHYAMPCTERGMGKNRLLHFFNPTQYDYDGVVTFSVFDWDYDAARAKFADEAGEETPATLLNGGTMYWGHQYKTFAMAARVPAFGFASYTLTEKSMPAPTVPPGMYERTDKYTDDDIVLENECLRAVVERRTARLLSLTDKESGKELLAAPASLFRLITEDTSRGMTAWRVGSYMRVSSLHDTENVRLSDLRLGGVRQWARFECAFGERSHLEVSVSLDRGSSVLQFDTKVDFHEIGKKGEGIPQLNFALPLGYPSSLCRYDVPFGTLERAPLDYDVPASSFAVAVAEDAPSLMLISDSKYGFRFARNLLALSLIRASYEPDPYPEYGVHHIRIGVGICHPEKGDGALHRMADGFLHPISYCAADFGKRSGTLPLSHRFLAVEGNVRVTALKMAEDKNAAVVRFHNNGDGEADYGFSFAKKVKRAWAVDLHEAPLCEVKAEDSAVRGKLSPYAIATLLVEF